MIIQTSPYEEHINLKGGWPTPRLHPVDALASASASLFASSHIAEQLRYGPGLGTPELRRNLAAWLTDFYRPAAGSIAPERIGVTNGASNGLATVLQKYTDPAFTRAVWMVEPTYFLACPIFRDAGLGSRIRGVPEDKEGVNLAALEQRMQAVDKEWEARSGAEYYGVPSKTTSNGYPKLYRHVVYMVPTFSNPSGKTMSVLNRRRLVELARTFDVLLVTDDVYDFLRWPVRKDAPAESLGPCPPRLVDIDRELEGGSYWGNSVSNGSFSKIVAPGVRVGWLEGSIAFVNGLVTVGATSSGGNQAHMASLLIDGLLSSGALKRHIRDVLIPEYRRRYYAMTEAIKVHLCPLGVKIVADPVAEGGEEAGGFFLYLSFDQTLPDGAEIAKVALKRYNLRVAPGNIFSVPDDPASDGWARETYGRGARLCWAWHEEDTLVEGIVRLAWAVREARGEARRE
ncbi:PLP-dependent transferase [Thozetella sp. PMI_491]|nr:PLP-dependent transferase [Thozetella sp. PMI_491]